MKRFLKFVPTQILKAELKDVATLALLLCTVSQPVFAGILSASICRPYKNLVDDDLYMVLAAISAVGLLIAWKTMGGSSVLGKAVSLLAALMVALNLENLLQLATGRGFFC